jgi:hypothetical protein
MVLISDDRHIHGQNHEQYSDLMSAPFYTGVKTSLFPNSGRTKCQGSLIDHTHSIFLYLFSVSQHEYLTLFFCFELWYRALCSLQLWLLYLYGYKEGVQVYCSSWQSASTYVHTTSFSISTPTFLQRLKCNKVPKESKVHAIKEYERVQV